MDERDLQSFAAQCRYGVLGTVCSAGTPQSAVVGIAVSSHLEIVFDTLQTSRKYPNLIARPQCSFVLWMGERTIQYEGEAEELKPPQLAKFQTIYFEAWPDGPARMNWPGLVYFVVKPAWIRYSDFDQRPPFLREWRFD